MVDREFSRAYPSRLPLLPAFLPAIAASLLQHRIYSPLLYGLTGLWTAFILWRGYRLMRAASIRGDRKFDREDKYNLIPDYAASESVLSANRRQRRVRRKWAVIGPPPGWAAAPVPPHH